MQVDNGGFKKQNTSQGTLEGSFGGFSHKWQYDDYVRSVSGGGSEKRKRVFGTAMTALCGIGFGFIVLGTVSGVLSWLPTISAGKTDISFVSASTSAKAVFTSAETTVAADVMPQEMHLTSIGCICRDTADDLERIYGLPSGVVVTDATAASELYVHDIITAVCSDQDGSGAILTDGAAELAAVLEEYGSGEIVYLRVFRRGREYIIAQPLK